MVSYGFKIDKLKSSPVKGRIEQLFFVLEINCTASAHIHKHTVMFLCWSDTRLCKIKGQNMQSPVLKLQMSFAKNRPSSNLPFYMQTSMIHKKVKGMINKFLDFIKMYILNT